MSSGLSKEFPFTRGFSTFLTSVSTLVAIRPVSESGLKNGRYRSTSTTIFSFQVLRLTQVDWPRVAGKSRGFFTKCNLHV